jgi:hypothetical protein
MADQTSSQRNALIDLYGDDGGYIALGREVWLTAVRDKAALERGRIPDCYENGWYLHKGQITAEQLRESARADLETFLHSEKDGANRELWAELGFGVPAEELVRRVGG